MATVMDNYSHNAVFKKAVEDLLPSAIPVKLKNLDDYTVGKVLVYSKKPLKPFALRKRELKFTGCTIESLLTDGQEITITTASNDLHITGKSISSIVVKVNLEADLDLSLLFGGSLNFSGADKVLDVVTEFGKISHITSNLIASVINKNLHLKVEHPTVQEAINNGGVMFLIHTIYESEHINLSAKFSKDTTEDTGEDVLIKVKKDAKGGVDAEHTSSKGTVFCSTRVVLLMKVVLFLVIYS